MSPGSSPHSPPLVFCLPGSLLPAWTPSCPQLLAMPTALAVVPQLSPQLDPLCQAPHSAVGLSPSLPREGTVLVPGSHPALTLQAQRDAGDITCGPGGGEWPCQGRDGAATGSPWALHRPGSRGWRVGFGGAVAPVQGGCSPGRGAEPCWPHGPLCLPRAGLRALLVLQVKRLENMLKFGLWLFGVPQANSECCPHPVPVPAAAALELPPLTALLSPQSGSRLASPCLRCTASACSTLGSRCRRWVLPLSPHPGAPHLSPMSPLLP